MTTLDLALRYLGAHISVLPIGRDKRPAGGAALPLYFDEQEGQHVHGWLPLQSRLPTMEELGRWWGGPRPFGIAAACGAFSAGLLLLDFDNEADAIFPQWKGLVESACPGLACRVSIIRTPRDPVGYHVWSRCLEVDLGRNQRLACDPGKPVKTERTLIETRGEGGYALLPGCPGWCHPSGRTYELVSGPPVYALPDLSTDEHDTLLDAARAFDVALPKAVRQATASPRQNSDGLLPGTDYDHRGDLVALLERHGWAHVYQRGDVSYLRRPGKDKGVSATYGRCKGQDGIALLKVFTSSTEFEPERCYGPFRAYAVLEHAGDLSAASRALARHGLGGRKAVRA